MEQQEYKPLKVWACTWQVLSQIKTRTGEPFTKIMARLASDELTRLDCTHTYPGGQDVCALCGARRKD